MKIKRLIVGEIQTNCYLVVANNEIAVIDPGDEADKILVEINNLEPAKLKYIINTHYHYDHVLANEEIQQKTGAEILIHEAEKKFIDFKVDRFLQESSFAKATADKDELIHIGDQKLKVIHTPGHTKGSICLLGDNFIFTGDTIFKDGYGRTDLAGGSQAEIGKSLNKLKKIIKPRMTVYPGHGEIFKYLST